MRRQHLSHRAVLAIEARQLRHGKAALAFAAGSEAVDRQEEPGQLVDGPVTSQTPELPPRSTLGATRFRRAS